jgi:hypothetical protein
MGTVAAGQVGMRGPPGRGQGVPAPHPPHLALTQRLLAGQGWAGLTRQSMCARSSKHCRTGVSVEGVLAAAELPHPHAQVPPHPHPAGLAALRGAGRLLGCQATGGLAP